MLYLILCQRNSRSMEKTYSDRSSIFNLKYNLRLDLWFLKTGDNTPKLCFLDCTCGNVVFNKLKRCSVQYSFSSVSFQLSLFHLRVDDKPALLLHLLRNVVKPQEQTVVFVATKHHVEYLKEVTHNQQNNILKNFETSGVVDFIPSYFISPLVLSSCCPQKVWIVPTSTAPWIRPPGRSTLGSLCIGKPWC